MNINDEAEITVFSGQSQKIEILMQQEVQLDINVPLFYIKSGEEEIQAYVNNHAKPQLDDFTKQKQQEISKTAEETIKTVEDAAGAFVEEEIKPSIAEYANSVVKPLAETAAKSAATAESSKEAAEKAAGNAAQSAEQAQNALEQATGEINEAKTAAIEEFNTNASEKQDAVDASAAAAAESADRAEQAAEAAEASTQGGFYNRVHDCILENPYHLNYKIEGDTFTLLPGSVLAYPDGSKVVTDTEISGTIPDYNSNILGIVDDNSIFFFAADGFNYGSIKPDAFMGVYPFWLDTANKVLKKRNEAQTDYEGSYPLPIICSNCAITGQGAVLDRGAGLLCMMAADGDNLNSHGMTVFVPAGIKGLIPNGFKTDGSFDNIEYVTPFSFKELASSSDSIKRIEAYYGEEKPIKKIHFAMTNSGEIDVSNRGYKINRNNYLVNRDTGNIVMGFELGFAVPGYIIDYEIGGSNRAYVEGVAHIKSTLDLQYPISIIYWND